MDTTEFIGSDHIIHAVDSNGNIWPPIQGSTMNSSNTDPKAKQISDRPNTVNEEKTVETKNDSLWLLRVRQDAIRSKSLRKFGY